MKISKTLRMSWCAWLAYDIWQEKLFKKATDYNAKKIKVSCCSKSFYT